MNETDEHYLYYEKLMRSLPDVQIDQTEEYRALAKHYPYLSKSILLGKRLEKLRSDLKSVKERSARLQIRKEMDTIASELKRHNILKALHEESKVEAKFRRRFAIRAGVQRLRSIVQRIHFVTSKLQERSRRAQLSRISKLPPSMFDLRSLDPLDRSLALREWIQRRKTEIR